LTNTPANWDQEELDQAVAILRRGGLVAYPTDTVFGLGANAFSEQAVLRVFQAKKRPLNMALPLLLADVSQLSQVALHIPELAWRLAEKFFPGALTLVLQKAPSVSAVVTGGGDTVAVRVPGHPVPIALAKGLSSPIIGTSANLSGLPSPVTADEVDRQLGSSVDLVIRQGRCYLGVESTILDLTGQEPRLLRQGAIPREQIEAVCGRKVLA